MWADPITADEQPDADYPFILITGRRLVHWHTGSMTHRAGALNAIKPMPVIDINPEDMQALSIKAV